MRKQMTWRVRVRRAIEDWVDVIADTPEQAETMAVSVPGVISVFGQSAMRGNKPLLGTTVPPVGVEEDGSE